MFCGCFSFSFIFCLFISGIHVILVRALLSAIRCAVVNRYVIFVSFKLLPQQPKNAKHTNQTKIRFKFINSVLSLRMFLFYMFWSFFVVDVTTKTKPKNQQPNHRLTSWNGTRWNFFEKLIADCVLSKPFNAKWQIYFEQLFLFLFFPCPAVYRPISIAKHSFASGSASVKFFCHWHSLNMFISFY